MPRHTEKDKAPDGYMTPKAAAELVGRSDQTIRNLVKDGKVEGTDVVTENGEHRYYISAEAVASMIAGDNGEPPAETMPPTERAVLVERYIHMAEERNDALTKIFEESQKQTARLNDELENIHRSFDMVMTRVLIFAAVLALAAIIIAAVVSVVLDAHFV